MAPGSRFDRENVHGEDRYYHLVLLAENNEGYQNLMKIVSKGYVDGFYYKPRVDMEVLKTYHKGIIALSACLAGEVPRFLARGLYEEAKEAVLKYQEIFGRGNYFLELQDHGIPMQRQVNQGSSAFPESWISLWQPPTTATISMPRTGRPTISCYVSRREKGGR